MSEDAGQIRIDSDGSGTVRLNGRMTMSRIQTFTEDFNAIAGSAKTIDISGVERMDTVGAWLIHKLARDTRAQISGADENAQRLLDAVGNADTDVAIRPAKGNSFVAFLDSVGDGVVAAGKTLIDLIGFLGATIVGLGGLILHPTRFRPMAMVQRLKVVGVDALGIVGLMSFLVGLVIAQQGAVQLRQFGMDVFTINLVGRSSMRELGVLMTAIMVAGRSGSAFAAELGTMKLTEEVDAMRVIGVSPMEALIIPRVLSAVLMMPLLGFYATLCALFGGLVFCWIGLDISPLAYFQRIREAIPLTDVWVGLVKAPFFGLIVAVAGCFNGMQVKDNAEQVGLRTTAAVVQGIFLVIVLDAFFAVFFTNIGWN